MTFLGIDGCKAGWFYIELNNSHDYYFDIVNSLYDIQEKLSNSYLNLIDIPIGLVENTTSRECDTQARRLLGKRKSSVFPAPCRQAIYSDTYEQASQINFTSTGKKLSKQSWWISKKIKEVDEYFKDNNNPDNIKEAHPELCFMGLNHQQEMSFNKKTTNGITERLQLLQQYLPEAETIYKSALNKYLRKNLACDDILDAMILAVAAKLNKYLVSVPEESEFDNRNITMEINYITAC